MLDNLVKVFVEEGQELLAQLEDELLELEKNQGDERLVASIFRAAHTIKGSAGLAGLDDISSLAHRLEDILDQVRTEHREICGDCFETLFMTVDLLNKMIALAAIGYRLPDSDTARIKEKLNSYTGCTELNETGTAGEPLHNLPVSPAIYKVKLKFREDFFDTGTDPLKLIAELVEKGELIEADTEITSLPTVSRLDPYRLYLSWNIVIKAWACPEEITDIFVFVLDDNEITIENLTPASFTDENQPDQRQEPRELEFLKVIKKPIIDFIIQGFLFESREQLSSIMDVVKSLDRESENLEAITDLSRRIHALKGNLALFLSVQPQGLPLIASIKSLQKLFQGLEGLLAGIREGKAPISEGVISLLLHALDSFEKLLPLAALGERAGAQDSSQLLAQIDSVRQEFSALHSGNGNAAAGAQTEQLTAQQSLPEQSYPEQAVAKPTASPQPSPAVSHYIRVTEEKVTKLMNIMGELAVTKNAFSEIAGKLSMEDNLGGISHEMKEIGQWVAKIANDLEATVMAMRMIEVRQVFQKFSRIVRDLALKSQKNVTLAMEGEETELDKTIIEKLGDPLLHLIRNAVEHGIEPVEQRIGAGKDPRGTIWLRAYNRGKQVFIEVEDDGKGMDPKVLKAKMDVVQNNIAALRGSLEIASTLGKGTKFTIQLPLTLAVSRGLLVGVGPEKMLLPLDNVIETLKIPGLKLATRKGQMLLTHRNEVLSIVPLSNLLGKSGELEFNQNQSIVILGDGSNKVGVIVDSLINEQEVIIKPITEILADIPGIGGATILGDGRIALVLNAVELVQMAGAH